MQISTKELINTLEKINKFAAKKSHVKELKTVKVTKGKDSLTLFATNSEVYAETYIDMWGEFECDMDEFCISNVTNIVKKLKMFGETTQIKLQSNILIFSDGKKETKVKADMAEEHTVMPIFENENTYNYNMNSLKDRYKTVGFAVSKDDRRVAHTGIYFNGCDMVALDGFRLAMNEDNTLNVTKPFNIKGEHLKLISDTLIGNVTIATSDKYTKFTTYEMCVVTRQIGGDFLDYKKVIPASFAETHTIDVKEMAEAMKYLKLSVNNTEKDFILWNKNLLSVKTPEGQDAININSNINVEIGFNVKYMLETMQHCKGEKVEFNFANSLSPILIEDNNAKFLVLPVRTQR